MCSITLLRYVTKPARHACKSTVRVRVRVHIQRPHAYCLCSQHHNFAWNRPPPPISTSGSRYGEEDCIHIFSSRRAVQHDDNTVEHTPPSPPRRALNSMEMSEIVHQNHEKPVIVMFSPAGPRSSEQTQGPRFRPRYLLLGPREIRQVIQHFSGYLQLQQAAPPGDRCRTQDKGDAGVAVTRLTRASVGSEATFRAA